MYSIDITAYAVMSNHYHIVLRVDVDQALAWSNDKVIEHWAQLHHLPLLIQRFYRNPSSLDQAEIEMVDKLIEEWRERLYSISWFMKHLNEHIARLANREDNCTGHFWEARFSSQALLDDTALLSCMAYVDLNPIRAGMAPTPELSDYTSIQERLRIEPSHQAVEPSGDEKHPKQDITKAELMSFAGDEHQQQLVEHLPFHFTDYIELVEWTGRIIRDDKRGHISQHLPPILQRLNLTPSQWLKASQQIEWSFGRAIGPIAKLGQLTEKLDQCWLKGIGACRELYSPSPH